MIGIFKTKKNKAQEVNAPLFVSKTTSDMELVEQIHKEFYTASDIALEAAKEILDGANKDIVKKAEDLKQFGFTSAKEVSIGETEARRVSAESIISTRINHYFQTYPLLKFISEEDVKKICNKYNLVCGDASLYTGTVPDKNLEDIRSAKAIRANDRDIIISISTIVYENWGKADLIRPIIEKVFSNVSVIPYTGSETTSNIRDSEVKSQISKYVKSIINTPFSEYDISSVISRVGARVDIDTPLRICAPIKDFDTTNAKFKNGVLVKPERNVTFMEAPDPVVLARVKGGFLIITAWGPEASDPLVVNQKMN